MGDPGRVLGLQRPDPTTSARPGMLTQGCYHKHIGLATSHELIWGDYYLLEALQVLSGNLRALEI